MGPRPIPSAFRPSDPVRPPARTPFGQDWPTLLVAGGTVLALVAVAAVAMVFAMSERQQLTLLRSETEDRLNEIDRELEAMGAGLGEMVAAGEVSRPDFADHVGDLLQDDLKRAVRKEDPILAIETAAAITRKAQDLKVEASPKQIGEIALGFLRFVDDDLTPAVTPGTDRKLSDPAIRAVALLMGYRSSLLPSPLGVSPEGAVAHGAMLRLPKLHDFRPFDSASRIIGTSNALGSETSSPAKLDLLSLSEPMLSENYRSVVVDGYDLKLDGLDLRSVLFSHCSITYSGDPVQLDNVYFSHCSFQLTRMGKNFAAATLASPNRGAAVKR